MEQGWSILSLWEWIRRNPTEWYHFLLLFSITVNLQSNDKTFLHAITSSHPSYKIVFHVRTYEYTRSPFFRV